MTNRVEPSFELNEEMLSLIATEFNPDELVTKFAQEITDKKVEDIENVAEAIFTSYGANLIRKSWRLGEEYPDRTYEVLREAIDSTGGHLWFPLIPQRVLEIAYLAIFDMELLPVLENSPRRLVYMVDTCKIFMALKEQCGKEVANTLPCHHACISACRTLFNELDYPEVLIEMEASAHRDGYCQFVVTKI